MSQTDSFIGEMFSSMNFTDCVYPKAQILLQLRRDHKHGIFSIVGYFLKETSIISSTFIKLRSSTAQLGYFWKIWNGKLDLCLRKKQSD